MPFRPAVHIPMILSGVGAVFLLAALGLLFNDSARDDLARGEVLPVVTAATLRMSALDEVVLVEGRLAADNRSVFREFVACQRDRFAGVEPSGANKGRERWTPMETLTPPLKIETADGIVAISNQGYEMRAPPHRWWDTPIIIDVLGKTGERANGFFAGDVVTVAGRVVAAPNDGARGRALEAKVLFGGDHAAYVGNLRDDVLATRILGGVFLGVGVLLLGIGGLLWRRAWRRGKGTRPKRR